MLVVVIFCPHDHMAGPWGKLERLSLCQRLFGKGVIPFIQQGLQQRMFRVVRLQYHFALLPGAAGTPGNLRVELGEAFCRPEICGEQRAVNVQQRHQGDVREMVAFSQHLRADQDSRAAAMHFCQMLLQRAFAAGSVAIDA